MTNLLLAMALALAFIAVVGLITIALDDSQ
jgi:hypothetical protein